MMADDSGLDSVSETTTASTSGLCLNLSRSSSTTSTSLNSQTQSEILFKSKTHLRSRSRTIEEFFKTRRFCDVCIKCGHWRVDAHKLVLSAASEYFALMFTADMAEAQKNVVEIRGVDPLALSALIGYCYTGEIELNESRVETVLSAACLLRLEEVINACSDFLIGQLHPSNCLGIRSFAETQSCDLLQHKADEFTMENFMEVMIQQEFVLLSWRDVFALLNSDFLNVQSETDVYAAFLIWLHHDLSTRKPLVAQLLPAVRLALLSPEFLADHVINNPVLKEDSVCMQLVVEALQYHLLPERRLLLQSSRTCPRKATVGRLYAVGGMDSNKGAMTIEEYNFRKNTWTTTGTMSGRRLQFGVVVAEDKLIVCGGRDGLKTLNTVECWEPATATWLQMPSMNTPRHGLGVAVLDGDVIYAVGGHDGWSYLSSVERWDPVCRSWSFVCEMSTPRSTAGVCVLSGKLYAVGGRDGSNCLRTVECYNPHTNKWNPCSQMLRRRGGVGVGVLNGYIYAVGGLDAPSCNPSSTRFACVERYDPRTDKWTLVSSLSSPRDAVGICPFGERLFAVGGYNGHQYLSLVEYYDPATKEWTTAADLCNGRAGASVVSVSSQSSNLILNQLPCCGGESSNTL